MSTVDAVLQSHVNRAASTILSPSTSSTLSSYNFSFTPFLRANNLCALASEVPACPDYTSTGTCPLGRKCTKRHPTPPQNINDRHHGYYNRPNDNYVCKHWLKGLCKKGDDCDYLHEYNLRKMSECQFYNQNGYCQNGDECLYVHIKEDQKLPKCEDYETGFCPKGPKCPKRHVRKKLCEYYLAGFCPAGRECTFGVHLRAEDRKLGGDERKRRIEEMDRREDDGRDGGKFGKFRGRGGRWRDRKRKI